jgi:hypothetical protein
MKNFFRMGSLAARTEKTRHAKPNSDAPVIIFTHTAIHSFIHSFIHSAGSLAAHSLEGRNMKESINQSSIAGPKSLQAFAQLG